MPAENERTGSADSLPRVRIGRPCVQLKLGAVVAVVLAIAGTAPVAGASTRPFARTSPLNRAIEQATIDSQSAAMIDRLVAAGDASGFTMAVRRWTVPVYYASSTTPRRKVRLTASWAPRRVMYGVPIPRRAAPDPAGDGHLSIVDASTGCEYDFYDARKTSHRWRAAWGNRIGTSSSGIFAAGLSARASGFALQAGLVRPQELRRGRIRHALVFSFPDTQAGGPVAPATQSDGRTEARGAIPIGAHLQLDPGLDLSTLNLLPWQRAIARALKRYGMFLADTSGGPVTLFARNPQSFGTDPYAHTIRALASVPLPPELLRHMRVLELRSQREVEQRVLASRCARMG